ncbi:MAG TPA: class I SAM-dependent methyltransferase [Vicinamibacterales bacterium]|nr:class I SAM-dependent methyltransferase [Vicinamibacterales bacterium]
MRSSVDNRREMLRAWAAHDVEVFRAFVETVTTLTSRPLSSLRVLDLGCGANAPVTVLLHASGCRVTGVDASLGHRWGLGFRPSRYAAYLREAGALKTLRKMAGELVFDRTYFRELRARTRLPLTDRGLDLRTMDVQRPTLPEGSFDAVHSNATWEHVADVRAATHMVADALTPGGIAYIEIHLFPSLSGGHDLPWIVPGKTILGDVKPWQHLRDPAWKAPVFLNRLRERDYRAIFENTPGLTIVDWRTEFTEGRDLLSPEVLSALPDYSPDELTKRSIIVVARKNA